MKVPDSVIKIKDLELVEHMDYVQTILNNGLYEMRIFGEVPDWAANDGENGIFVQGNVRQLYFHLNGVWVSIGFNSLGTLILFDADGDTGITPELTLDEDIIRFYASGFNNWAMGTVGFAMAADVPVIFDGLTGDTKVLYSTASVYHQFYVDGSLRMEM